MKVIYLKIKQKTIVEEEKLNNTLLWFDMQENKMHKFQGGKLSFHYDATKKKNIPIVKDTYIKKQKIASNQDYLHRWIEQNFDDSIIKQQLTDAYAISLFIDDKDLDKVVRKLQIENIEYDI